MLSRRCWTRDSIVASGWYGKFRTPDHGLSVGRITVLSCPIMGWMLFSKHETVTPTLEIYGSPIQKAKTLESTSTRHRIDVCYLGIKYEIKINRLIIGMIIAFEFSHLFPLTPHSAQPIFKQITPHVEKVLAYMHTIPVSQFYDICSWETHDNSCVLEKLSKHVFQPLSIHPLSTFSWTVAILPESIPITRRGKL